MDDAPYTEDLDLSSATSREELANLLRTVHLRADRPSLRTLETRTRNDTTPLSKTVVYEMLKGIRFPRKAVMIAFLRACGVRDDHMAPWQRAWEKIAIREPGPAGRAAESPEDAENWRSATGPAGPSSRAGSGTVGYTQAEKVRPGAQKRELPAVAPDEHPEQLREQVARLSADNNRLRRQLASADWRRAPDQQGPTAETSAHTTRSPTARRRELGIVLRALREQKGLTVKDVAEYLMCSASKVRGMEASFRAGTLRDVRDLCVLYEVIDEAESDRIMSLAREGMQTGWWQGYDLDFATYVGLEAAATAVQYFQSAIVPGLLQTPGYARATHEVVSPRLAAERIDELVDVRMMRQRRLTEEPVLILSVVMDEAALHRVVGGPAVMRIQLDRLIELARMPDVTMRVIPFTSGAHPAMDCSFRILKFGSSVPEVVYVEALSGGFFIERPEQVRFYSETFGHASNSALSPQDSIALIESVGRGYDDE